ncbi:MAG: RNA pseudouridine synthase [Clostridia bacterium]
MKNSLEVIYEDNHIIVVIKPINIPSQGDKSGDIDMLTIVKSYLKEKYNKPGDVYLGLVHRLDRMVSGLMVFAKTSKAASRISKDIRENNFKKRYYAIVCGTLSGSGLLENYLIKNEKLNKSRVVDNIKDSKLAILEYNVLKNFVYKNSNVSLVDINLKTGRHHQIRVQFANIFHPLYGDTKYNNKKVSENISLFSYYLSFFHPTKDEYLEFKIDICDNKYLNEIWRC